MTAGPNDALVQTWESDRNALLVAARTCPLDDPRGDAMLDEAAELEALIGTRIAIDRQGVLIKARLLARYLKTDGDDFGSSIVDEIIGHLGGAL